MAVLVAGTLAAYAAFPTKENTEIVNPDEVTGNWDSFKFNWVGMNDQKVTLVLSNSAGYINITNYFVQVRLSKAGTTYTEVNNTSITKTTTSITFQVAATNIGPVDTYQAEAFCWEGATTNLARTLAQGKVVVSKSLYSDTNSFPFPTPATNMSDYLTIAAAAATYAQIADSPTNVMLRPESEATNAIFRAGIALAQAGVVSNQTAITGLGTTNDTQNARIASNEAYLVQLGVTNTAQDLAMTINSNRITAATNAIDAAFLASKGGVTNGGSGATLTGITAAQVGAVALDQTTPQTLTGLTDGDVAINGSQLVTRQYDHTYYVSKIGTIVILVKAKALHF